MIAIDYLKALKYLPVVLMRGNGRETYGRPSNSEIYRWLKQGSVLVNGTTPKPNDSIEFPIKELVFFPKGKRRITFVRE